MSRTPPHPIGNLTGFQRDLVRTIARNGPAKGLDVKDALEGEYGEEIRHGRLYPQLDALVERGLVVKGELDGRTNEYRLTDRGRALIDWLADEYGFASRQSKQRRIAEEEEEEKENEEVTA